jgi:uncharacterized membrane protein YcaP (DUF421 family)
MQPEQAHLSEWGRIFLGEVPPAFYVELCIRALLIYALLILSLRLLGKRMSAHISLTELTAMVALASAIGVPMLSPQNGLLPALIIALVIVGLTRLLAWRNARNQHFEAALQGNVDVLVEDARMCIGNMRRARITPERLLSHLRSQQYYHLGAVKRVYLEADGNFSIVDNRKKRPGLLVLPEWDKEFIEARVEETDLMVCGTCGMDQDGQQRCANCGAEAWTHAVIEKKKQNAHP